MSRQPDVEIICVHCGARFLTPFRRRNRSKYCNHRCFLDSRAKGPKISLNCLNCDVEFSVHHCYKDRRLFCERNCYIEYWTAHDIGRETEETAKAARDLLDYDPETGILTWKRPPHQGIRPGTVAGFLRKDGYLQVSFKKRKILSHRLAWAIVHGRWPQDDIDHVNRDRSDNRLANLREATRSQNVHNRTPKHSYLGVYRNKNRFVAYIGKGYKRIHVGSFLTEEEAYEARIRKAEELGLKDFIGTTGPVQEAS